MAKIPSQLSPEKAAFINALTDAELQFFITQRGKLTITPSPSSKPSFPAPYTKGKKGNRLIIGDLHAPFIRQGYLEWCRTQQERWGCEEEVIMIGDIVDLHACAQWEADPDGMSAGAELDATREALAKVYAMFPKALVTYGNHDLRIARKAKSAGLPSQFIKTLAEIYDAPPTWTFGHDFLLDNVKYTHGGAGGNAERVTAHSRISTVQGHLHTQAGMGWSVSERDELFFCQTGCGVDDKAYAFAYSKPYPKKSVIGCAVVLDKGKTPISLLMPL